MTTFYESIYNIDINPVDPCLPFPQYLVATKIRLGSEVGRVVIIF
jgi:hypothetical protein